MGKCFLLGGHLLHHNQMISTSQRGCAGQEKTDADCMCTMYTVQCTNTPQAPAPHSPFH